jgi:hypothetical protein
VLPELYAEGPLRLSIYGLTSLAVLLFLWRTIRHQRRIEPFLSLTLLLTLVPFVVFSWRCCSFAEFVPLATELNNPLSHFDLRFLSYQAAYSFQFGVFASSALLSLHVLRHFISHEDRNV